MKLTYKPGTHAYYLDGKRCRSVSDVAKIPDDDWALSKWRQRMVLLGVAHNPTLAERAAAHHDDKSALDALVEEALTIARARDAAGMGTASHRIAERVDLNLPVVETAHGQAVTTAWRNVLKAAELEVITEYVERIVVHPAELVAGRYDRLVFDHRAEKLRMLDIKTGARAMDYPHAMACQLAMYANAKILADMPAGSGSTESFHRMPDVDTEVALIVHMPTETEATLYEIDIAAGWQCVVNVIFPTLRWRKRKDLVSPSGTATANEINGLVVPLLRSYVLKRMQHLRDNHPDAFASLPGCWPVGVPTLKQSQAHDESQLDAILAAVVEVEGRHRVPFYDETDPRNQAITQAEGAMT